MHYIQLFATPIQAGPDGLPLLGWTGGLTSTWLMIYQIGLALLPWVEYQLLAFCNNSDRLVSLNPLSDITLW